MVPIQLQLYITQICLKYDWVHVYYAMRIVTVKFLLLNVGKWSREIDLFLYSQHWPGARSARLSTIRVFGLSEDSKKHQKNDDPYAGQISGIHGANDSTY